jgi:plasmid stabilization system protein ParE
VNDEIRFHPAARAEVVAAAVYLESKRVGYGEKFDRELVALCERIVRHPNSGTPLDEQPDEFEIRSFRMTTFRYTLLVATVDGEPMVYAVAHQHRKPGYWYDRLQ